jgi:hypothetical protein
MKKVILVLFVAMLSQLVVSCHKQQGIQQITFSCSGEWQPSTKDLSANSYSMTDIWILDYVGSTLVQTIHQSDNTAADFGSPSIPLAYGTHTLYFVASRGTTPTLNTTNQTITWAKPSDTFQKSLTLTVSASTPTTQSVTLERMVAKLRLVINDAIATGTTAFTVTPATWYYGINYTDGSPASVATNQAITVNCPASNIGLSGQVVTVFTPSSSAQWNTNVTFAALNGTTTISSVTIPNVPLQRNHPTEYSGNLFTSSDGFTLSLNDTWDDPFTGSW